MGKGMFLTFLIFTPFIFIIFGIPGVVVWALICIYMESQKNAKRNEIRKREEEANKIVDYERNIVYHLGEYWYGIKNDRTLPRVKITQKDNITLYKARCTECGDENMIIKIDSLKAPFPKKWYCKKCKKYVVPEEITFEEEKLRDEIRFEKSISSYKNQDFSTILIDKIKYWDKAKYRKYKNTTIEAIEETQLEYMEMLELLKKDSIRNLMRTIEKVNRKKVLDEK